MAVIFDEDTTVKLVAAPLPNFTEVAPVKPLPVIVTVVPPRVVPDAGLTLRMAGVTAYVYWSADEVGLIPPGPLTVMSTVPVEWAGLTAEIFQSVSTVKLVALTVPNFTAVAPVNVAPVMVTVVPPSVEPERGVTAVRVGVMA